MVRVSCGLPAMDEDSHDIPIRWVELLSVCVSPTASHLLDRHCIFLAVFLVCFFAWCFLVLPSCYTGLRYTTIFSTIGSSSACLLVNWHPPLAHTENHFFRCRSNVYNISRRFVPTLPWGGRRTIKPYSICNFFLGL